MSAKILIVEDNEVTAKLLGSTVVKGGYTAQILNEGAGVLDAVQTFGPDLILMDIMLPDMNGAEIVKEIHGQEKFSKIPIIFLSSIIEEDTSADNTMTVNEKTYPALSKTSSTKKLLETIQKTLSN